MEEGDPANSCFIIVKGLVSCFYQGTLIQELGPEEFFGESALYVSSTRAISVKAKCQVELVSITREKLTMAIGGHLQDMIFSNYIRWAFDKSKELHLLSSLVTEQLIEKFEFKNKKKDQVIVSGTTAPNSLVIVLEGFAWEAEKKSTQFRRDVILNLDHLVKNEETGQKRRETISMGEDGVIAELSFKNIQKIFQSDRATGNDKIFLKHSTLGNNEVTSEKESYKLSDFVLVKAIGKGQFGHVYLVKEASSGNLYALKVMSKLAIYDQGLESYVLREKKVLLQCNHPFLVKLKGTLKTADHIIFVLEMIIGVELFYVIREIGILSNTEARFYGASILLAIEHLHGKGVVYRDLKPENLMVNSKGFIRLIDMGTAKFLGKNKGEGSRTKTIIGTPHYMAPEMFIGRGYSFPVDLWSVGICLYEFVCGFLPFGENENDPYHVYKEIQRTRLSFGAVAFNPKMASAKSLIERLLSRVPEVRLGASFSSLKAHKFFVGTDWAGLAKVTPPLTLHFSFPSLRNRWKSHPLICRVH